MAFDLQRALHAVVEQGGSDLHLKVPSRPLIRLRGELTPIEDTDPLSPADTERVLREMLTASERLAEFARDGEIDFSYTVRGLARFRVNAFRQRGSISIACRVVPFDIRGAAELGLPDAVTRLADEVRGTHPRDGHHRLGEVDHARGHDRPHQPDLRAEHRDDRGPDRVPAPGPALRRPSARDRLRHQFVRAGAAAGAAPGPGRDPDRGDAGRGDGRHGAERRGDRSPRAQHAAHDRRRRDREPHHRLLPPASPPAGARDAGGIVARRDLAATGPDGRRRGPGGCVRGADDDGPGA